MKTKRIDRHIAIEYQFRKNEPNRATIEEERKLGEKYGVQSCKFEVWENATVAMTCSLPDNESSTVSAIWHLIKMITRKHRSRRNVKILNLFIDTEMDEDLFQRKISPYLST